MKTYKHNFILIILLCTSIVFGQKQVKNINEKFKVNKDVLVEIDTQYADVTVETWNKNIVTIKGVWEVEGMTKEEAIKYFEGWDFEALGNKRKVVITSQSSNNFYEDCDVFNSMDFDFDYGDFNFEPITHIGELFNGYFLSTVMPPMGPLPPFPAPRLNNLSDITFDNTAYQKDKEGYMKAFEKRQKEWEKKMKPKMKEYEVKMKQWEKENEPKMKDFEEKMEKRSEEFGDKFGKSMEKWGEEFEKSMGKWGESFARKFEMSDDKVAKLEMKARKLEKKIGKEYAKKIKRKKENTKKYKITKRLLIKIPKKATLRVNAHHGTITLPDNVNTIH